MITEQLVNLSRLQFALTAMYHYLFVPLTLGLSFLLVIMESCYVITGKDIYRDMTRFWGKLFGINFAMGVATGITMEFQFGTNWAYYSHYVGDIFGAPLAIEGLMAFFLESTFIGLFFFGWNRLSRLKHLAVTFLMALGSNISALWILIANSWMQYPTGSAFNDITMRMEMTNFWEVVTSPWAQSTFMHTINAGYMTGAIFVISISAYYLLQNKHRGLAIRSLRIGSIFGLIVTLFTFHMGDESAYLTAQHQPGKLAAMEAMWETHPAPAPLSLFAIPDEDAQRNHAEVSIPALLGFMGTRSLSEPLPGIKDIITANENRIRNGAQAVTLLEQLRREPGNTGLRARFDAVKRDLGYGLLLRRYSADVTAATPEHIREAARSTVPKVAPMYWSFRIMIGAGCLCLLAFILGCWYSIRGSIPFRKPALLFIVLCLPLPWIACEIGWFVTEYGRQPWSIYEVLPVHLSVSSLSSSDLWGSLGGFIGLYTLLLIVEIWLMVRTIGRGPAPTAPTEPSNPA